jgi:DNA-binding CsgD family transcriptional regulator
MSLERKSALAHQASQEISMQQQRAEQIRREIIKLCHAGLDSRTLQTEIMKRLQTVIPIDVSFFTTIDPATLLFTGAVVDDILMRSTPQFIENEFLQNDVNKLAWMAKSNTSVMNLVQATQGKFERSQRYREILAPLALGDELRAALITGGTCWGFLCLHRDQSSPHFTLAEDLSVVATTPTAERWLAEVAEADWPRKRDLPYAVLSVVGRLQALDQDIDAQPDLIPRARLRTASGHWLVLHASRLSGSNMHGQIAVIFEVAQPSEVAPLIVQAYDLSKRESEILQSVLRGLSTSEISEAFHISSNTVQDHFKAIFEKVGVHSRRELAGQLFSQQYQPRIASGRSLGTDGWFT